MQIAVQLLSPFSESGIPTKQTICLWNKQLKTLPVWHIPFYLISVTEANGSLRGEGVYEELNHEKS